MLRRLERLVENEQTVSDDPDITFLTSLLQLAVRCPTQDSHSDSYSNVWSLLKHLLSQPFDQVTMRDSEDVHSSRRRRTSEPSLCILAEASKHLLIINTFHVQGKRLRP